MKTTSDLPDDGKRAIRHRSQFPLVRGRRPEGMPEDALGPEAVARLLVDADVEALTPVTSAAD